MQQISYMLSVLLPRTPRRPVYLCQVNHCTSKQSMRAVPDQVPRLLADLVAFNVPQSCMPFWIASLVL